VAGAVTHAKVREVPYAPISLLVGTESYNRSATGVTRSMA